jgi:phage protein D
MSTFLTQKIVIEIFGDSRRRVGDIVDISVPKIQSDAHLQFDKQDANISGQYMVTSIKHSLAKMYTCKLELSRNCMGV